MKASSVAREVTDIAELNTHERNAQECINRYRKEIEPQRVVCSLRRGVTLVAQILMPRHLSPEEVVQRIRAKGFDPGTYTIIYAGKLLCSK